MEKVRTKEQYDKRNNPLDLQIGDKVWLLNMKNKGKGTKLQAMYIGPYDVTELTSDVNVKIKIENMAQIVHKNLLKRHVGRIVNE